MGKITNIHFKKSLLIGTTEKGFILFYIPDQTNNLLSIYTVEDSISTLLVKAEEDIIYVGTETGKITAFETTV